MSKHTPGPWQVLPEEMGKSYLRVRGTLPGLRYKIADVRHVEYEGASETEVQMTKANARLIAAAPELLYALEHILKGSLSLPRFSEEQARAAIAKATGK